MLSQKKEISVTTLIQRMREELVRRNYATTTIRSYLKAVEHFREYINAPLDQLGPEDIRSYRAYLLEDRKLNALSARPALSSRPLRAFSLASRCLPSSTAGVKTQRRPSWLHRARRASGFLQVAPIRNCLGP